MEHIAGDVYDDGGASSRLEYTGEGKKGALVRAAGRAIKSAKD